MENFEVASVFTILNDTDLFGVPVVASVQDSVCCFITLSNRLVICDNFNKSQTFLLDEDICNSAIQLRYLSLYQVVVIVTRDKLLLYNPREQEVTILHSFSTSVSSTSWIPSETFVVVVDEKNVLYGFSIELNQETNHYSLVEEVSGHLDEAVPNSTYVGWGSQNTQFKGTNRSHEENIEEILQPYSAPVISWRGNDEQLVINFWRKGRRFLKVFDRLLRPKFQSEAYTNLLPLASFKGQGNFIACVAVHKEINKLVIFEKNCLVKLESILLKDRRFLTFKPLEGEAPPTGGKNMKSQPINITLPLTIDFLQDPSFLYHVKNIQYHPEMNVLAIYSEDASNNGYLNIYLNRNATWYLKQELVYPPNKKLIAFHWASFLGQDMCALNILTSKTMERISFRIIIYRYPETKLVAVVHGRRVHFTKFSDQIVPPPISSLSLSFENPVSRIYFDSSLNLYQFLTSNGSIHSYVYVDGEFRPHHDTKDLPVLKTYVNSNFSNMIYRIKKNVGGTDYELALDRQQNLLINGFIICHHVLSIYVHENYLLFSHASCKLFCVRLIPQNLDRKVWNNNYFYSREIEQGAKIVCVTNNSEIIIQLPRGNLESVTCRLIAIDTIEELLSQNRWVDAMFEIRRQKLTWNILIDLNPARFSEHIRDFIEATETISELNVIILEFSNDDCFRTVYQNCIEEDKLFVEYNKTTLFSQILEELVPNLISNLIAIVTLQLRHFSLRCALKSVLTVFHTGDLELARKGVSQILLYKNFKDVVSEAIKLYNPDFVIFLFSNWTDDFDTVALAFKELNQVGPIELRYKMNLFAKDPQGTTKYMVRCPDLGEDFIAQYILKHGTQKVAYDNVCESNIYFKPVTKLYASYLSQRARHDEAGFILEKAEMYKEALEVYRKSLNFYNALGVLALLQVEESDKLQFFLKFANDLVIHKRIDEAVIMYEVYCKAHVRAIEILTENKMFQRALVLARIHNCSEALENLVVPAIGQYRTDLKVKITELEDHFETYVKRLQKIRHQKLHNFNNQLEDGDEVFENDLYSEHGSDISSRPSSAGSGRSRGSTASARNRRKQEKKKIDLRQGGVYEDIAIIRQLYLLAVAIFECGNEVREICLNLSDQDSFNECGQLQEKLCNAQDKVRRNIPEIWSDIFVNAPESTDPAIMAVIHNRNELDDEFRKPPPNEKLSPNCKLAIYLKD